MIKCINTRRLEGANSLQDICRWAVEAGFAGLELSVGGQEPVTPVMLEEGGDEILRTVKEHSLKLCSLTSSDYDLFSLAGAGGLRVEDALDHFGKLLLLARHRKDETMVTIGAHVVRPLEDIKVDSYEETFNRLYESLEELTGRTETDGTSLALENPGGGLLLSPLELRELIDQVNSPYLGVGFNPENARQLGNPLDWCRILGRRIKALRVSQVRDKKEGKYLEQLDDELKPALQIINKQGWEVPVIYLGSK